jgi:hypothetical protein
MLHGVRLFTTALAVRDTYQSIYFFRCRNWGDAYYYFGSSSVPQFPMYSSKQSPVYTCSPHWHMMASPNNGPKQDVVCLASVVPSKC